MGSVEPPKTRIFSYWHDAELSPLAAQCVASWRQFTTCDIIVLSDATLPRYVPASALPSTFASLHAALKSDIIRLFLLFRHGGAWLDATVMLTRPLDFATIAPTAQGYYAFYQDANTRGPHPESWLLVSRQSRNDGIRMLLELMCSVAEYYPTYSDHPIYRSAYIRENRDEHETYFMIYDCYLFLAHYHAPPFAPALRITRASFAMNTDGDHDVIKHTRHSPYRLPNAEPAKEQAQMSPVILLIAILVAAVFLAR
jgi:hypothetical protein